MNELGEVRETKIIRKVLDDGKEVMALDIVDEFENIQSELGSIELGIRNSIDIDELLEAQDELITRRDELLEMVNKWHENASIMEKISVIAIKDGGSNYFAGPIGATYEKVVNDSEIQSDEDLMTKLKIFKEKCFVVTNNTCITLDGEYKGEKFVCNSIMGEQGLISNDARSASIDFKTGEISNYENSVRPDWQVNESYVDQSIIDNESILSEKEEKLSKLEEEAKAISEAEALIEQQKEGEYIGD